MFPIAQLDEVKKQHNALYKELQGELFSVTKPFGGDTARRVGFLEKVDALLRAINLINGNKDLPPAEYHWLSSAVQDWQFAISSILGLSKDIPILQPPQSLGHTTISEPEIQGYLARRAHEISQARKQQKLFRRLGEELHRLETSSKAEILEDWYNAQICFASDILKGEGVLWQEINSEFTSENQRWTFFTDSTFRVLQRIWLRDVIRFHAYVNWVARGADSSSDTKIDYVRACRAFRGRVAESSIKFEGTEALDKILDYLLGNYITSPSHRLDRESPKTRELIENKARRIHELTGSRDDAGNWYRAEEYVSNFYNNVMLASLEMKQVQER